MKDFLFRASLYKVWEEKDGGAVLNLKVVVGAAVCLQEVKDRFWVVLVE